MKKEAYLIVLRVNSKFFITLADNNSISAYDNMENLLSEFDSYVRKFNGSYESSMSATVAMMQINPFVIKASIEKLAEYLVNYNVVNVDGGISLGNFKCVEVKENIQELNSLDIFGYLLEKSGLKQK